MRKPYRGFSVLKSFLFSLSLILSGFSSHVFAQLPGPAPGTVRGIELYQQGDAEAAIFHLREVIARHPDDASAWYYLGLAYYSQGLIVEARSRFQRVIELWPESAEAHAKLAYALILANEPEKATAMAQRAIELGDQSPETHFAIAEAVLRKSPVNTLRPEQLALAVEECDNALSINSSFAPAWITKSFALFHLKRYFEAASSLEGFLGISPDDVDADTWRAQLEQMRERAVKPTETLLEPTIFSAATVTQKARVTSKPEPQYTEAARKAGVVGTAVLRAVFASDGEVKRIFVLQGLGYGLTTKCVEAARRIKFQPALKDGSPVSMYIQLEYNFNLY